MKTGLLNIFKKMSFKLSQLTSLVTSTIRFFLDNAKYALLAFVGYSAYVVAPASVQRTVEKKTAAVVKPIKPAIKTAKKVGLKLGVLSPPPNIFKRGFIALKNMLIFSFQKTVHFLKWLGEKTIELLLPPIAIAFLILLGLWKIGFLGGS